MNLVFAAVLFTALLPRTGDAPVRIAAVEVSGNRTTDSGIIKNYLYVREGDVLGMEELAERVVRSERRLLDTRYFSHVKISTHTLDAENIRVLVDVREGFLWRFTAGTWFIQIGRDNLFGKGVDGSLSLSKSAQSLSFDNPYFRGTPFLLRMQVTHALSGRDVVFVEPEEDFEYRRVGVSWSVGYNFNPDLAAALVAGVHSFELEEEEFNGNTFSFLKENGVYGRTRDTDLGLSFLLDRRDNRLVPSEGQLLQGAFLVRDGVGGITLQALEYLKTSRRTHAMLRLSMTSFGDGLPYHLWQGMGGIGGLKFPGAEDRIGRTTLLVSLEPRLRFLEIPRYDAFLELRAFIDAGAAVMEVSDISFDRLVSGYGLGLRLWIGYPYFQNAVAYYGFRSGQGKLFFRFGSSF
jgi:hypothetical protein